MTDIEILTELIQQSATISLSEEYGKLIVKLDEPSSPDSSITIRDLPPHTLVIKVDVFTAPYAIFQNPYSCFR